MKNIKEIQKIDHYIHISNGGIRIANFLKQINNKHVLALVFIFSHCAGRCEFYHEPCVEDEIVYQNMIKKISEIYPDKSN